MHNCIASETLHDHLKLKDLPLATTPGGREFCLKALHPSDHTIAGARLPGGVRRSTVVTCDYVFDCEPLNGAVTLHLLPHPIVPVLRMDQANEVKRFARLTNPVFNGEFETGSTTADFNDTEAVLLRFIETVEAYRITAMSATCELIAPALANQGTVVAAQYTNAPQLVMPLSGASAQEAGAVGRIYEFPPLESRVLLGTVAYNSVAKDGVYMPLKLTSLDWKFTNDAAVGGCFMPVTTQLPGKIVPFPDVALPFTTLGVVPPYCTTNFGEIFFRGLAPEGAIVRVRVRQCLEIIPFPGTQYAPFVAAPLPPDELARRMYIEVAGRMEDAYPASYNDWGWLRDHVIDIAKKVLPYVDPVLSALSVVPGVGTAAGIAKMLLPGVTAAVHTIDDYVTAKKARKKKAKNSAASVEPRPAQRGPKFRVRNAPSIPRRR